MDTPDEVLAKAGEVLDRATHNRAAGGRRAGQGGPSDPRQANRPRSRAGRRLARVAMADAAILLLAMVVGLIAPLGVMGAFAVFLLLVAATITLLVWPGERLPTAEKLREADIKALPRQTDRWLQAQRPALPAPAVTLVDQIGVRLETLGPQLATLDNAAPAAEEVRKLIAEQLPEFVRGYQRVPAPLRAVPRNGTTPDAQLIDGLKLIERQIGELSQQIAQGDLDALSTRGRYLEIKYQGDGASG